MMTKDAGMTGSAVLGGISMEIADIHTHILPGVDDGARDWEACMQMLDRSAACGVRRIIATPHYLPWKRNADRSTIERLCAEAEERFHDRSGITMQIFPGNEIWYHAEVPDNLKSGKICTLAGSRYVLVEFSTGESYTTICRAVQSLREAGYIPILAHVERYESLRKPGRLKELRSLGACLQMNVEVLQLGRFSSIGRWVGRILREERAGEEIIQFLASDMHNMSSRPPLSLQQLKRAEKALEREYLQKLLHKNSNRIFAQPGSI